MKGYGQFCPFALTSEIFGERWTLLILREIGLGSRRFNDIHRGVPRMSPSLLAQRLRTLEKAGVIKRRLAGARSIHYELAEAGLELGPVMQGLAVWGKRWVPATLGRDKADPDFLMWDIQRRIDLVRMPSERTVIRFEFTDQPKSKRHWWIYGDKTEAGLCITDPGLEIDLFVSTDSKTMTWVWYGDIPLRAAIADGSIRLDGPRHLREGFPSWLMLNLLAPIPRRRPLKAA